MSDLVHHLNLFFSENVSKFPPCHDPSCAASIRSRGRGFGTAVIRCLRDTFNSRKPHAHRTNQLLTCTETQEIPLLGPHTEALASFLLLCGANRNLDAGLRIFPLNALNWTVQ